MNSSPISNCRHHLFAQYIIIINYYAHACSYMYVIHVLSIRFVVNFWYFCVFLMITLIYMFTIIYFHKPSPYNRIGISDCEISN